MPNETRIEDLKDNFVIAKVLKYQIKSTTQSTSNLPNYREIQNMLITGDKSKYILCRKEGTSFTPVVANTKKVGTPRLYLIRGQDIYSGELKEFARGFVMEAIKKCYLPYIKDMPKILEYPCKIECEIHDTIKNFYDRSKGETGIRWDVDNLAYPYLKAFPDLLVREGKLRDDDRLHLPRSIPALFVPIDNHDNRKLVFTITKEDRPEITEHPVYKNKETYETEDKDLVNDFQDIRVASKKFNEIIDGKEDTIF